MTHWFDRVALWSFVGGSAYFLMMLLTNQKIFIALPLCFLLVYALRRLLLCLPERRWLNPRKRRQYAADLVRKWAFLPEDEAFSIIKNTLPSLIPIEGEIAVYLHQAVPDENEHLTSNQVLKLWKIYNQKSNLWILSTCPATNDAFALCSELSSPSITLVDSRRIITLVSKTIQTIPESKHQKGRLRSIKNRVAQYIDSINPLRIGGYSAVFLITYSITHSAFCLSMVLTETALLFLHYAVRLRNRCRRTG